jgi:diguanylate cyclase (GGDEF)-like protein
VRDLATLAQTRVEARTDDLTGVANRRALMVDLDRALREGGDLSLLVVDLDRFKEVNDRYGHATGDALLRTAAARLRTVLPADALLARLGGDEFAIAVRGDETEALALAGRVGDAVRGRHGGGRHG